jgi:hypothetical protein
MKNWIITAMLLCGSTALVKVLANLGHLRRDDPMDWLFVPFAMLLGVPIGAFVYWLEQRRQATTSRTRA